MLSLCEELERSLRNKSQGQKAKSIKNTAKLLLLQANETLDSKLLDKNLFVVQHTK
jgi:hypothetical protein